MLQGVGSITQVKNIELSDTTAAAIEAVRKLRPEWESEEDDYIIFSVLTEWLAKQDEQSVNEWIREFF